MIIAANPFYKILASYFYYSWDYKKYINKLKATEYMGNLLISYINDVKSVTF